VEESPEQAEVSVSDQIAELQARISFQENTLSALDQVVARQDREILTLKAQLVSLVDKLNDLQFALDDQNGSEQERPPHY